jgi:outer membrane receptor protein involved in Fe transport
MVAAMLSRDPSAFRFSLSLLSRSGVQALPRRSDGWRFPFWRAGLRLLSVAGLGAATASMQSAPRGFVDLDIEQLMDVRLTSVAGLTITNLRSVPVSLTQVGARDIQQSGVRDLNHLFELYVPNGQFIDHHHLQPHVGLRGIISDREDKYLYQVNGRTMNNLTLLGADNERALPLLGDINTVNVVRGPASATHGAGALAGVIDVETFTGMTFEGSDATLRHGFVDRYTGAEIRHGRRLTHNSGVFAYYGVARVYGANSDYYLGRSFPATNGLPANIAGQPTSVQVVNHGAAGFGELWHKLHLSYVRGPVEIWGRFVQDGGQDRPMREIYTLARPASVALEEWTRGRQFRSRQLTTQLRFKRDLSPQWNLELAQGFDRWAFKDQRAGVYALPVRKAREDELIGRAIAVWTPADSRSLAFGMDYSHVWFHDPAYSDTLDRPPAVTQRKWTTDTFSLIAEHQWKLGPRWTSFLSFRADKHTFSSWMNSPRATLVFAPTERDTFKLMAGQSVRRGGDEELWSQWQRSRTIPRPESARFYELSYQRKPSSKWQFGANAFVQDYDAIGWIPSLYYSSDIGEFRIAGGELEISYTGASTRVTFSEGYSKLLDSSVPSYLAAAGQTVTSQPYGYGNDLAEWAPFITKLSVIQDLTPRWRLSSSLVHYSGFPGARDYADYARTVASPPSAVPLSDAGYTAPYGPNLFINLGVEFRPSDAWLVRLDAYNLAALADETLSKRNYYFRLSEFSVQPASLALSLRYRF